MSNAYDNASLLVTPNGYEAGTIFSAKPTDGSGDLSFSRASTAMRRNSAGLWESVANDVPRLHYPVGGGCPSWLFEPQATNSFLNSNAPATQAVTVANATVYTISVRGIGVATLSGAATGVITGTNSEGSSLTVTTSSNSLIVTVTGLSGTVYVQVETGSVATSPIITTGSTVTRLKDDSSVTLPSVVQGTVYGEVIVNGSGYQPLIYLDDNTGDYNNRVDIACSSGGLRANIFVGGVNQSDSTAGTFNVGLNKFAVVFTAGTCKGFLNGVLVFTANPATIPALTRLKYLCRMDITSNANGSELIKYNTTLSDSEAIALTTL
jgi:hypothetical protein